MTSLAMTRYHTLRAPAIALSDYRLSLDAVQAQGAAVEVVCRSYAHAQMRIRASDTALTELLAEDGERDTLRRWAEDRGEAGLAAYRAEKNTITLDGYPTGLLDDD